MFINCPYCSALVATDPVTDLPPTHCPQCRNLLRRDETVEDDEDLPAPADLGDLLAPRVSDATHEATQEAGDETNDTGIDEETSGLAMHASADEDETETSADDDAAASTADVATTTTPVAIATVAPAKRRQRNAPSFVRGTDRASTAPRERWLPAVAAALALLLALQWLLADRARLAADARWRPLLGTVCGVLRCTLPPWREPTAFTLLQRDVRQHPGIPGALRVSATFRNDARWPQPWPKLRLTLSDVNGRPAGERTFRAEEYLGGPPSQPELASGESATVAMDILEPAARIVAYDFSFR